MLVREGGAQVVWGVGESGGELGGGLGKRFKVWCSEGHGLG